MKTSFLAVPIFSCTQVRQIFILIDVKHLQNVFFSFEKHSNDQNHSCSGSNHLMKNSPAKFPIPTQWKTNFPPSHPFTPFGKSCTMQV